MENLKPIKIGLVGCGLMGAHYADVFNRMENTVLTACCDPTPLKLEEFAEKKGFSKGYLNYHQMIETEELDALLNVTPDRLHFDVAEAAVRAGIPLMTEKPLASTMTECRFLRQAAEISKTPVVVNFSKRNAIAVSTAGTVLSRGLLGDVARMEISYQQGWIFTRDWGPWETVHAWTWRLSKASAPMGVLSDLGSHMIDIIRYISGREIIGISGGRLQTVSKDRESIGELELDSPDIARAGLILDNGVPVSLLCSRADTGHKDRLSLSIYGSKGSLEMDLEKDRKSVQIMLLEDTALPPDLTVTGGEVSGEGGFFRAGEKIRISAARPESTYQKFIRAVDGNSGGMDYPDIIDGCKVQAVMDAITESDTCDGITVFPESFS